MRQFLHVGVWFNPFAIKLNNAQNPLDTFPRNFSVDVGVLKFGKRHDTTDTTDFCQRQLVTDFLWGNW